MLDIYLVGGGGPDGGGANLVAYSVVESMKFGRIYSMTVEGTTDTHIVNYPLTCKFRIQDAALPYGGQGHFLVYNLAPDVRRDLQKDFYEQSIYRQIIFSAGYQTDLPLPIIFQGNVQMAFSYRQGPDWITELFCYSGMFAKQNTQINLSVPYPYNYQTVLEQAVATLYQNNVREGVIGTFNIPNGRGVTYCGNTWDILTRQILPQYAQVSINNEAVNILNQDEIIEAQGAVQNIDADTGLLESPRHQQNLMTCKMIFEPRFTMYQSVLVTSIEPGNSGTWRVQGVDHMGTISGAVCEALNTMVTLFQSPTGFEAVN